jgi:hypothetical protein
MDAEAISRVTEALRDRIKAVIHGRVHIGPLDDHAAGSAAVVLFLYRVAANADLRNAEHRVFRPPQGPIVYHKSLPLDLHYLLTVSPAKDHDDIEGLKNLGFAMRALNEEPYLVGKVLQNETVRLSLETTTTEEMSRIWALFPTANYRTSAVYVASPVWIDPETETEAAPVTSEEYKPRIVVRA